MNKDQEIKRLSELLKQNGIDPTEKPTLKSVIEQTEADARAQIDKIIADCEEITGFNLYHPKIASQHSRTQTEARRITEEVMTHLQAGRRIRAKQILFKALMVNH